MALFSRDSAKTEKKTAPKKAAKRAPAAKAKKEAKKTEGGALAAARYILRPRITEKAAHMTTVDAYVFEVAQDATKSEVIKGIQAIYGVVPRKVRIVRIRPRAKISRFRGRRGQSAGYKKAYVFLNKGEKIEYV